VAFNTAISTFLREVSRGLPVARPSGSIARLVSVRVTNSLPRPFLRPDARNQCLGLTASIFASHHHALSAGAFTDSFVGVWNSAILSQSTCVFSSSSLAARATSALSLFFANNTPHFCHLRCHTFREQPHTTTELRSIIQRIGTEKDFCEENAVNQLRRTQKDKRESSGCLIEQSSVYGRNSSLCWFLRLVSRTGESTGLLEGNCVYLDREVRTVQRWEKRNTCPFTVTSTTRSFHLCLKDEIDNWRASRSVSPENLSPRKQTRVWSLMHP